MDPYEIKRGIMAKYVIVDFGNVYILKCFLVDSFSADMNVYVRCHKNGIFRAKFCLQ